MDFVVASWAKRGGAERRASSPLCRRSSTLYYYGVSQGGESGNWSPKIANAWVKRKTAPNVKVGVIDVDGTHSAMALELIVKAAPKTQTALYAVSRDYPDVLAPQIVHAVDDGCNIIVLTTGWATPEATSELALAYALANNVVVVCSTPNDPHNTDAIPDYPSSYHLPNVLPVAACDRAGKLYWSATNEVTIAAPGRNIMAAGFYSSGTSYAAPILAGVMALVIERTPAAPAECYVSHLLNNADNANGFWRLNAQNALWNAVVIPPTPIKSEAE